MPTAIPFTAAFRMDLPTLFPSPQIPATRVYYRNAVTRRRWEKLLKSQVKR